MKVIRLVEQFKISNNEIRTLRQIAENGFKYYDFGSNIPILGLLEGRFLIKIETHWETKYKSSDFIKIGRARKAFYRATITAKGLRVLEEADKY